MAFSTTLSVAHAQSADGQELLKQNCQGCHQPKGETLSRIGQQRKTPEGWLMTIARMQIMHGLQISAEDRSALVKHLGDTQGLAPEEADNWRYAMERRLNTIEEFENPLDEMCARCHSGGRVALQRRTAEEWEHLVHFHLGQWPSLEYQALARDRAWMSIALEEVVPKLAEDFPLQTKAWSDWQVAKPSAESLVGSWSFSGHMPAEGHVHGVMNVEGGEEDFLKISVDGEFLSGEPFKGSGSAILYNGYEWRGSVTVGDTKMRQVFAAIDGEMRGRMFETEHDERGLDILAVKEGQPTILDVQPGYVEAGGEAELLIVGTDLSGQPDFGPGVEILEVVDKSAEAVRVRVKVAPDASVGVRGVAFGEAEGGDLAVFETIDEVRVVPNYAIARVGGGSTPKVQGRFEAEAWGKSATGEAFRIGFVPAEWKVEPFNEQAAEDEDVKFAGKMQENGVFVPAGAGPNPERRMSTNNAGNLKVIATVEDDGKELQGEGQLIVTVQRWNNPPLP